MAIAPKIKHVDPRPNGVLRFRRRFPKDVAKTLGQQFFQVHIRNTSGIAFAREYDAILREFDRMVTHARDGMKRQGTDNRTAQQKWHDALMKAEGLREGVTGLNNATEAEVGELIAQSLPEEPDPLLKKALAYPSAPLPEMTLGDAFKMFWKDKEIAKTSKKRQNDLKRIEKRLRDALGDIDKLALKNLSKTTHRRQYRDFYVNYRKRDGEPMDGESMQRETNIVVSVLNHVKSNTDENFRNDVFSAIPWPSSDEAEVDKKQSLPDDIVDAVTRSMQEDAKIPELQHVWALMVSTGARVSEFAALVRDDVKLDDPVPHLFIRPNAIKAGRKTKTSIRSVPLTRQAQTAMREALKLSESNETVFPRYATASGNTNLSGVIMKHVDKFRNGNKKLTTHGLRHRVSDKMRDVGAPVEVRQGYLGHAMQEVAENIYGGREARLREFVKWAEKAGL